MFSNFCFNKFQKWSSVAFFLAVINMILLLFSILDWFPRTNESIMDKTFHVRRKIDILYKEETGTVCETIQKSSFATKSIALVRILGPSLPPLQSPNQMEMNLRHILTNEIEVRNSKDCIKSFWVTQCMTNLTSERKLIQILEEFGQEYYKSLNCSFEPSKRIKQTLNINYVRNYAIRIASEMYNPQWILPLDGNVFFPGEAIKLLVNSLVFDTARGHVIHLIPFFRVLGCQKEVFTNNFVFAKEMERYSHFHDFSIHPAISDVLSRRQEGQFALSSCLGNIRSFFSTYHLYSHSPKLSVINDLKVKFNGKFSCGSDVGKENKSDFEPRMQTVDSIKRCGYVIRLSYWPEKDKCPYMETPENSKVTGKQLHAREFGEKLFAMSRTPEVNSFIRKRLRERSVNKLTNQIGRIGFAHPPN